MTERTDWYRSNADHALAHRSNDLDSKRSLLAMANAWLAQENRAGRDSRHATTSGDSGPAGQTGRLPVNAIVTFHCAVFHSKVRGNPEMTATASP
jgi:hypothetical protein